MSQPTGSTNDLFGRALAFLAVLMFGNRVKVIDMWVPEHRLFVQVNLTGYADAPGRTDLLTACRAVQGQVWQGDQGTRHVDWTGSLLTMRMILTEQVGGYEPEPPAAPSADPVTEVITLPARPADMLMELVDRAAAVAAAPVEVVRTPGETTAALRQRYAGIPGVIVVPGGPQDDPELHDAWSRYARARALAYFVGRTFPDLAAAQHAVDVWPGRDMMEPADVLAVAEQLVVPQAALEHPAGILAEPQEEPRPVVPRQERRGPFRSIVAAARAATR